MRISLEWLADYVDLDLGDPGLPERLAEGLLLAGLEVEALERPGAGLAGLVVAEVRSVAPHPGADRLRLCRVDDGAGERPVVCGAPNVAAGQRVVLAPPGTVLPDGTRIRSAKIRGERSEGMICSERELGLGEDHSGILVLGDEAAPGTPAAPLLGLDDVVFDISITPNRPDCLSALGVAREAAALLGLPLHPPDFGVREEGPEPAAALCAVEILDPDKCPRYAARVIRGVRVGASPGWLQRRLRAAGMRPINNVVDVTNYVMLSLGQPLHAFDLGRLEGRRIIVRRWRPADGPFATLDGQERRMSEEDLMICDAGRPVAIGGVMGGRNSEVGAETADLLLESAYFAPATIRRTRRRLGLSTEASYRFERGADPAGTVRAADWAAELIRRTAGGAVAAGVVDVHPAPLAPPRVRLRVARVSALLGMEVSPQAVREALEPLGVSLGEEAGGEGEPGVFEAEVPLFRPDIEREIDLVEEVARRVGYGEIPATLPATSAPPERPSRPRAAAAAARGAMVGAGYFEAINYSFVSRAALERMGWDGGRTVALRNPLSAEMDVMRTTLLAGLMGNAALNLSRGVEAVRLFELGRTFEAAAEGELPRQVMRLGALATEGGGAGLWPEGPAPGGEAPLPARLFDLKGALERAARLLRLPALRFEPLDGPEGPFDAAASARVFAGEVALGLIGRLRRQVREGWEVRQEVSAFEVDLDAAARIEPPALRMRPLPRYPATLRDLAVVVNEEVSHAAVEALIREAGGEILESLALFDIYRGPALPVAGEKSLAYSLVFRRSDRTLTDGEVGAAFEAILARLAEGVGARLRA